MLARAALPFAADERSLIYPRGDGKGEGEHNQKQGCTEHHNLLGTMGHAFLRMDQISVEKLVMIAASPSSAGRSRTSMGRLLPPADVPQLFLCRTAETSSR